MLLRKAKAMHRTQPSNTDHGTRRRHTLENVKGRTSSETAHEVFTSKTSVTKSKNLCLIGALLVPSGVIHEQNGCNPPFPTRFHDIKDPSTRKGRGDTVPGASR